MGDLPYNQGQSGAAGLWRVLPYAIALGTGLAAIACALPWRTIAGAGAFRYPVGDLAENLLGHLAYQVPGLHWPLLSAPALGPGISIALTDSNPAMSVPAKLLAALLGHRVNLLGVWLALCLALQPVAAVYALRRIAGRAPATRLNDAAGALLAAVLCLDLPAYLFRVIHINLLGQFLLLAALGASAGLCRRGEAPALFRTLGLLMLAILVHAYLFVFCAAILGAPALHGLVHKHAGARAAIREWALACMICIAVFMVLNGIVHAGGPGFGLYSTNLLSPVWPQFSGIFGAHLPLLDATGYQHEGFNYLGAGVVLLLGAAVMLVVLTDRRAARAVWRHTGGLVVVVACLFALAVTPRVTIGALGVPIDVGFLDRLLAPVRASGRAIWVVDDALLLAAIAYLAQCLRPRVFLPLAAAVLALQWIDTRPLRSNALAFLSGAAEMPPDLVLPANTTRFGIVPLCETNAGAQDEYMLLALRSGAVLDGVRTATPSPPAACAASLQSGLRTPLQLGETRLFLPEVMPSVRQDALGQGVTCVPASPGLLCHRGT